MTDVCAFVRRHLCTATVLILLAGLSLFAPTVHAADETGTRVLVMPFAADVAPDAPGGAGAALWLGEAAPTLLVEGLGTRGVGVMARNERAAAFVRLNLPMSSALTRATTIRVGELIGASHIVFGEIRLGERMSVRARLVSLATGAEVATVEREGALEDIFDVFDDIAAELAARFERRGPPQPTPPPLALGTFETYMKGLVASAAETRQRFLEAAVREAPEDPRILMALWDVYTTLGRHDLALASANAVPAGTAFYRPARFAVALSMIELRRFEGALQLLGAMQQEQPAAAIASLLGVVQLRQGVLDGPDGAVAHFQRAVVEQPGDVRYLFNLGYAYARAGQADEALTWLREAVRVQAAAGDAHRVMSAVLASVGRWPEAERELELARLLGGTASGAPPTLSTTVPEGLEQLPDLADLSSSSVRASVVSPTQRDQEETARFHLGNARRLIAEEREREAEGELRRAAYLSPYEEEPHRLLGGIHLRAGRLQAAIEAFTVALWCRETAAGRAGLARALLENGDVDGARREAQRALVLEPGSAEARAVLEAAGR